MKRSYAGKIRRDQAKFTALIPGDEINQQNPEPVIVRPAVDGSVIGRKDVISMDPPRPSGGLKMRKTPYYYADR